MFVNVKPLSKVKFIDDESSNRIEINDKTYVNKYLRLDYFEENVINKYMQFGTPDRWVDPYEQLYYKRDFYKSIFDFDIPDIHCLCLTENNFHNEDAMWYIYRYGTRKPVVKVEYNLYELLQQFNDYCEQNKYTLYIGKVDYSYSETQIDSFINRNVSVENYNLFFPSNFELKNYLKLLLIKRKQFIYENEIRLFLISDQKEKKKKIVKVKLNYEEDNLIPRIRISPLSPSKVSANNYRKKNTEYTVKIKEEIKSFLNIESKKLHQCRLYEPVIFKRITEDVKEQIFERDERRCRICGSAVDLVIDNTVPRKLGGEVIIGNLETLCRRCNCMKAAKFEK